VGATTKMARIDTTFTALTTIDQRAAEIRALVAAEGIKLAIVVDIVLWFEDRGFMVDLHTGVAMQVEVVGVTPLGRTINHLLAPVTDDDIEQTINSLFSEPVDDSDCEAESALQTMIDYGAELQEFLDAREDERFNRYHCS
jgi:hypothetical protein